MAKIVARDTVTLLSCGVSPSARHYADHAMTDQLAINSALGSFGSRFGTRERVAQQMGQQFARIDSGEYAG